MGSSNRNRIKLPSGLEFVRRHIAVVVHRDDGGVTVCVVGYGQYCLTGDAAAFRAWWDAPKAKRVQPDSSGFIGTDVCECGHKWREHILRGALADECGQCSCRSFRLATPEPPAEPVTEPWVATHGFMDRVARVTNLDGEPWIQIHAAPSSKHVELDALADRIARLLNESEVTG